MPNTNTTSPVSPRGITPIPERWDYRHVAHVDLGVLPFARYRNGKAKNGDLWCVPPIDDYGQACAIGAEYAAHFARLLKDNPFLAGRNNLALIVAEIDFASDEASKGYRVGFFAHLEFLILAAVKHMDPFEHLDRIKAAYAERRDPRELEV